MDTWMAMGAACLAGLEMEMMMLFCCRLADSQIDNSCKSARFCNFRAKP
jgi:hypothetical protein